MSVFPDHARFGHRVLNIYAEDREIRRCQYKHMPNHVSVRSDRSEIEHGGVKSSIDEVNEEQILPIALH